MTDFSGSYTGKVQSNTTIQVPDVDDHVIGVTVIPTVQKSSDPLWEGATMTYCATSDVIAGTDTQQGYYINRHLNGDHDYGVFEGKVPVTAW